MPKKPKAGPDVTLTVQRKSLLAALTRARTVIPRSPVRPILGGVRLSTADGLLRISATDAEIALTTTLGADGALSPCVGSCEELTRRLKASKAEPCVLRLRDSRLLIDSGRVRHALPTLPEQDFPPTPEPAQGGQRVLFNARHFAQRLAVVEPAMARTATRYAITGALLESDDEGVRLVATDGRRLVRAELAPDPLTREFKGRIILPARVVTLVQKLAARERSALSIAIEPAPPECPRFFVRGEDWQMSALGLEGSFPAYRDVTPASRSKFLLQRLALRDALREIALATTESSRGVHLDLGPTDTRLSAESPELGQSTAELPCRFLGGGDDAIRTAFNPAYLLDAIQALAGEQIVIDVDQNRLGSDGAVFSRPALLYSQGDSTICWVVMPIARDLPATRESLGSNYKEPEGSRERAA